MGKCTEGDNRGGKYDSDGNTCKANAPLVLYPPAQAGRTLLGGSLAAGAGLRPAGRGAPDPAADPLSPPGPFSQPIADRNAVVGIPSRPGINPTNQNGGADLGTGHSCVSSKIAV